MVLTDIVLPTSCVPIGPMDNHVNAVVGLLRTNKDGVVYSLTDEGRQLYLIRLAQFT